MTIDRLTVRNFRSVKDLDFRLGALNAIIGPNNSGKSNILRALHLVLGETWPSARQFSERDVHSHDTKRTIEITVYFDEPLNCDSAVSGFRLAYSEANGPEYYAVDADGDPCEWGNGRLKRVSNEMRDEVSLLYVDLERQAERQLRPSQWTLYGKLLRKIEASIDAKDRDAFAKVVKRAYTDHISTAVKGAERIIREFVRGQTGLNIRLAFRMLDELEVLKNIRPYVLEPPMTVDPQDVGAGVQGALAVGIAKAYADIVSEPVVLAIEEPELYLHPHGCRNFYEVLRRLSEDGLQIIYTTHERSFVNAGAFEEINIVRKTDSGTTVACGRALSLPTIKDRLRVQSKFNERLNEVFFAACVVLVEGDADEIACRCALEELEFALDQESVSIIALGGVRELPAVAKLLAALDIPTIALVDEDPGNGVTEKVRKTLKGLIGDENVIVQSPDLEGVFGMDEKPNRVKAMTEFPEWFEEYEVPEVYATLLDRIGKHCGTF